MRSLYTSWPPTNAIQRFARQLVEAKRLVDFSISNFSNAIRRAFHLSVVAVVTLEAIRWQLYELIFPQPGVFIERYGGVGQVLLTAQNYNSFGLSLVMIVSLLVFDFIAVSIISWWLNRKYQRHYGGQAT